MRAPEATFQASNCSGRITHRDDEVAIKFDLACDSLGNITIHPEPVALTNNTNFLRLLWYEDGLAVSTFTVEGTTEDGWAIRSETAWFEALAECSSPTTVLIHMRIACDALEALAPQPENDQSDSRCISYTIAGLRTYQELNAEFDFGEVSIRGSHERNSEGHLSGIVSISPNANQDNGNIDNCLQRVLTLLSFANGRPLSWAIRRETRTDRRRELTFVNNPPPGPHSCPPFSFLHLEPFVAHAATHYTNEIHARSGLGVATQWRLAHSRFVEVRIVQGMIALEHLLHCDKAGRGKLIPKPDFRKLRPELEAVIDSHTPKSSESAKALNWKAVRAAVGKLNQRALKDNLITYLDRYGVPLNGLEGWIPEEIIRLRNDLVHQGLDQGDRSLLAYEAALRELHTRIFLARLAYEGRYTSWINGPREEIFTLRRPAAS